MPLDHQNRSFEGRVFRSPTLFEDMVKCILLCNCQWPRTLSMAQSLCELQLELQNVSSCVVAVSGTPKVETEDFIPKTPAAKESSRKGGSPSGVSTKGMFLKRKLQLEVDGNLQMDHLLASNSNAPLLPTDIDGDECHGFKSCQDAEEQCSGDGREYFNHTGNFPLPSELANLDESFLAKRCKLGYRASYIKKLAQAIVEDKIQLTQLEELSEGVSLSNYKQLEDQLKQIKGFGPFTRANVHSRNSTSRTIEKDVEEIYGKYEPYQFLAYWSEIWDFYEKRFGKLNEMHSSDYKLITAANMKSVGKGTSKRKRPS
ncbi:DNA glycosylase [Sesbania bispinosa]|nr:DNA glycosylase [Sesbania bispinosa]